MASAKEIQLLVFTGSPFANRAIIALEEKEVDYEIIEEDFVKKSDLLLKSNPIYKKIPVLIHNGKPIIESLIIVQYIDESFPGKSPILPADPYARSQARFWADFIDKKIPENALRLWRLKKGEELEEAKREFFEILKTLEMEIGEKKYFAGEEFGFVDIAFVPFTSWFYAIETFSEVKMEEDFPKIAAWGKRCLKRDSVSNTLPDPKKVLEFINSKRKKQGLE